MVERAIAYQPSFDREAYLSVPSERKRNLDLYTRRQLETHLGERFNVLLSKTRFEIRNGEIYGENTSEPFLVMVGRGVEHRKKYGDGTDMPREQAELDGFTAIQNKLANPDSKAGTMMLSVSPPGGEKSSYRHNFYDIFTLKEEDGERYIEARRYTSALTIEETAQRLSSAGLMPEAAEVSAEYFLSHPIEIEQPKSGFASADNVHKLLHIEHQYVSDEEFREIIRICTPLITSYINTLSDSPIDIRMQLLTFNAIMNKADMAMANVRNGSKSSYVDSFVFRGREEEILKLGSMPVREVATGCGASGGFSLPNGSNMSPFRVSEYGSREWFTCPKCNYKADGPIGNTCPGCGLTKEAYLEESGADACA